ncbi:Ada metal-binding domain-containing protein [Pinibacter soli]|uniref:Ada metal-binding domain-containing protein n=1 Tax=Pinibacter soli TaxID=3044211 RepID=A0ABT6REG3_9BACT|nr:Ada metal-binding domain-containing protein [Pinibacter soli]MDI3320796.1 Ada metal-binding domain-containing protein [Pinibacter soli]
MIRANEINFGGNVKLKIYGKLDCKSGKRMKKANRFFFQSVEESIDHGFRPCAQCMYDDYKKWKAEKL